MNKFIVKAKNAIANKKAEMYVSKVVWVLAVIVVGLALMVGVRSITNSTILPKLAESIQEFFDNANGGNNAVSANGNANVTYPGTAPSIAPSIAPGT